MKKIFWVDSLSARSVWALWRESKKEKDISTAVHYFGNRTPAGKILARILGLEIKKFRYDTEIHDLKDQQAIFWHAWEDSYLFGWNISDQVFKCTGLIDTVADQYTVEKWLFHFKRQVAFEQKRNLGMIRLVHWHIFSNKENKTQDHVLWLKGSPWEEYLKRYAKDFNVSLRIFPYQKNLRIFFALFQNILSLPFLGLLWCVTSVLSKGKESVNEKPKVGVFLAQGLDINKKSDIFWFPESGLNPQDVIIYSFVRPAKFTIAGKRYIERAGIKMVHLLSKDLRWGNDLSELSAKYFELLIKETLRNIGLYIKLLLKKSQGGRALFNWQLNNISWLLDKSLQYVAFFKAKNIKVHFGFLAEDDPIMSAVERGMEENKGVLVYAHWSNPPLVEIWPSVDTFFVWGPYYKQFYEAIGYQLKNVVYSGYIFDSLFSKIEKESEEYRRKLSENGVKFTLAFFDNAYIEDGGWFSKESMRDFQSRLLSLVKSNPDWGIILKPKRKKTFDDITDRDILSMLNEIEKEGRCLILDHDVLPVTVGKAADLVIGLGSFSSPAVEVALCQKPVLFYDPSKQSSHPFHKEGLDKIVFEDIDKLCDKLKSFSQDQNREDYQSLDFVIEDIDPYRDGRSYQRVGSYIRNILRGFQSEKTKQGALDEANQQFMNEFGIDKVIRIEEQKNSKFILNTGKI